MKFEPAGTYTTWDIRLSCKDNVTQLVHGLKFYGRQNLRNGRLENYAVLVSAGFDIFFVATTTTKITNPTQFWERELKKELKVTRDDLDVLYILLDLASIVHVRHFTRMSQRRFRWGDCEATREDVQMAAKNEDSDELIRCMPTAANAVKHGCFDAMPALWDNMQKGTLALTDIAPRRPRLHTLCHSRDSPHTHVLQ